MANQSQRGGMKQPASQTGGESQHQGVHPGSTSQSKAKSAKESGSRQTPGPDPHAGERAVPRKEAADDRDE